MTVWRSSNEDPVTPQKFLRIILGGVDVFQLEHKYLLCIVYWHWAVCLSDPSGTDLTVVFIIFIFISSIPL